MDFRPSLLTSSSTDKAWFGTWAPGLLQPIFRGGELTARRPAAPLQPMIRRRLNTGQTVLKAFQDVADVLRALEADARTLTGAGTGRGRYESDACVDLKKQYGLGAVSYLFVC